MIKELVFRIQGFITLYWWVAGRILKKKFGDKANYFFWDESAAAYKMGKYKIYWETLGAVSRYQNERISGNPDKDPLTHTIELIDQHCERGKLTGLCIGCAQDGSPEMVFCQSGRFESFEVIDIAGDLLKQQAEIAKSQNLPYIQYLQKDLNLANLEENRYDFIWALGTIHHIEKLEHLFEQINKSLKKTGVFVMREYVGPNHLQLTQKQLDTVTQELATIPFKYKLKLSGMLKRRGKSVELEHLLKYDPSESIRSEDIREAAEKALSIVTWIDTGGTLLHPLLNDIAFNFELDEKGEIILQSLIEKEKKLLKDAVLPSDYVFCVGKKLV